MLLDNFLWIFNHVRNPETSPVAYITKEQHGILTLLNKEVTNSDLILSEDNTLPYLSTIYSRGYSWVSHPFTTPHYQQKLSIYNQFLATGQVDEKWNKRKLIFIFNHTNRNEMSRLKQMPSSFKSLFVGKSYTVLSNKQN